MKQCLSMCNRMIKFKILLISSLVIFGFTNVFAEKGTFVDEIMFIQYLDENTALEEVRNGNLDLYFFRVSSDRLSDSNSRQGLQVFESTGGYYSILANPAVSEKFNPFSIKEIRFALNYLVDRNLIVNELIGGFGTPMISNYGTFSADYLSIIDEIESYNFVYNPTLANQIITEKLEENGAKKIDGIWNIDEEQIEITFFIRSDDPVRKAIGEILASDLENIGFKVKKDYGDLNKAFVVVYGSNPADQKWNLYTEGWGSSGFSKYDSVGLAQMYSPWFSNMPGNNNPANWNYKNDYIDSLTQKIYSSEFSSAEERASLIEEATKEGVNESVRIFLASKIDQYVANNSVDGIINALGAGVPTRFTPINAMTDTGSLIIGVKQIYQGSWNPVGGFSDTYSNQIWLNLYDPGVFAHPFTGKVMPVRSDWQLENSGKDGKVAVPDDAITWDVESQTWRNVGDNITATSKVTFDLNLGDWHHSEKMDMNDILYSTYFLLEWGSEKTNSDKTYDSSYSPQATQNAKTLVGIKPIDGNTIEVYVDYWHFDEAEIASWASAWSSMPWELLSAMENAVTDGKMSFSRSDAASKNVNWLSLIVPHDARVIQEYLKEFKDTNYIPAPLEKSQNTWNYFESRYDSSISWIEQNNHAVISNGPFYLDRYSPDSRTIVIRSFDIGYPLEPGKWKEFEDVKYPKITGVDVSGIVNLEKPLVIPINTEDSTKIYYFVSNSKSETVTSGILPAIDNTAVISLSEKDMQLLSPGSNTLKIFASSDQVLRPDMYTTSFIATVGESGLPTVPTTTIESVSEENPYFGIISIILGVIIVGVIVSVRKRRKQLKK